MTKQHFGFARQTDALIMQSVHLFSDLCHLSSVICLLLVNLQHIRAGGDVKAEQFVVQLYIELMVD